MTRDAGDLLQRQVAIETKQDHLALGDGEGRDGIEDGRAVFHVEGPRLRIVRGSKRGGPRIHGLSIQPDNLTSPGQPGDGDTDGDPSEPRTEGPVASEGRKRLVGLGEGILCHVLSFHPIAEDPTADTDHRV